MLILLVQINYMNNYLKLTIFIIICELVGLISTPFTINSVQTWYQYLNKPFFSPPNWVFGPVWTLLYLLMGVSAYLIWRKGLKKKNIKPALIYFSVQLFFNFLWSIIFFGLHSPFVALIDIVLLLVTIFITILKFYNISKPAAYLLIPYILWVSFATLLNLSIILLNK